MTQKCPFKFYKGDENRIIIEQSDHASSIFSNEYYAALGITESIYARNEELQSSSREELYKNSPNTVVFCGDRGEGKTSCMMTVRSILNCSRNPQISEYLESIKIKFAPSTLLLLDIIDPAHFDTQHNILELVLGQLYNEFKRHHIEYRDTSDYDLYSFNKTAEHFSRVKRCLSDLNKTEEKIYDELEELDCLSASMSLKQSLSELFKSYLSLNKKKQLLICIDDLDYNITDAYRMVKQISTYLQNPYCILFVTVKLPQLASLIQNDLETITKTNVPLDTYELTSKLIQKLFPISHRIEMPNVMRIYDSMLMIYERNDHGDDHLLYEGLAKNIIPKLIFQKTRYLFYNHKEHYSPIIPQDLRGLRQLLGILINMPDIDSTNTKIKNKNIFKNYFYNEWIKCLDIDDASFARDIINEQNTSNINHLVVNQLINKYNTAFPTKEKQSEISPEAYRLYYSHNVSIGDVLYVASYIERHHIDARTHKLLFFIKSYYSILLCDNYDIVTQEHTFFQDITRNQEINNDSYLDSAWYRNTNALQRLVNGEYFNFGSERLIPLLHQGLNQGWSETVLGHNFYKLLMDISNQIEDYNKLSESLKKEFESRFVMLEYLILNIKGELAQSDIKKESIKAQPYPYYLTTFKKSSTFFLFDVLGIFYNIVNIKYSYDRFLEFADIYAFAENQPWSLISRMREAENKLENRDTSKNDNYALASSAILRNTEIITTLKENAIRISKTIHPSDNTKSLISQLYKGLIMSGIKTYEPDDKTKPKEIKYTFLSVITEIIETFDEEKFGSIFMEMYSDSETQAKLTD